MSSCQFKTNLNRLPRLDLLNSISDFFNLNYNKILIKVFQYEDETAKNLNLEKKLCKNCNCSWDPPKHMKEKIKEDSVWTENSSDLTDIFRKNEHKCLRRSRSSSIKAIGRSNSIKNVRRSNSIKIVGHGN